MWLRSQDKTKLINLRNVENIGIAKSYGGKDGEGNKLNAAIVIQSSPSNAQSVGLYRNTETAMDILRKLEDFISSEQEKVFQMP